MLTLTTNCKSNIANKLTVANVSSFYLTCIAPSSKGTEVLETKYTYCTKSEITHEAEWSIAELLNNSL